MIIIPKLLLTDEDFKPIIEAYKKQMNDKRPMRIVGMIPQQDIMGNFSLELTIEPISQPADKTKG